MLSGSLMYTIEDNLLNPHETRHSTKRTNQSFADDSFERFEWRKAESLEQTPEHLSVTYPQPKRKRSVAEDVRDRKMQKISSNLANDIARSLSFTDPDSNFRSTQDADDIDMLLSPDTKTLSQLPAQPSIPPLSQPSSNIGHPAESRVYRKCARPFGTRRSGDTAMHPLASGRDSSPIPTLRRISLSGALLPAIDLDQWLMMQALRQQISVQDYKLLFQEKKKQLQQCLQKLHTSHPSTDTQRYEEIKENLGRILSIADELSGDHSLSFAEIFPEWRECEGHLNKLASYVQSIEDMKHLNSQTIPRTNDLLHDIKYLQSVLEAKHSLYGECLVQNGLEWKTMGMPVDEHLLAATKGWFYSLSIGLLRELDTECSKAQSLVTDMRELVNSALGEKLMDAILHGIEFISGSTALIGLPSRKLTFGCRVLATVYGHWISENLGYLNERQIAEYIETGLPSAPSTSNGPKIGRTDLRLMQCLESMTRVLAALHKLQEVDSGQKSVAKGVFNTSLLRDVEDDDDLFDGETVLENLTSLLVEITVRTVAVIETSRVQITKLNSAKSANIMVNPQMVLVYMQEALLTFADQILELSGRDWQTSARLQVIFILLN
ncbi:hypothetical protein CLU79DRAFT_742257 [Phycomyces nitens]|nr:hypothetical protein CLU79DRAFT_742257 [Phycomyces nitens]